VIRVDLSLDDNHRRFLAALRAFLDKADVASASGRNEADALEKEGNSKFFAILHESGWAGVGWPKEHGGRGGSAIHRWLYLEELSHRRLPRGDLTLSSVGPAIFRFGTEEQKDRYLPGILKGDYRFAVGYSEPDAGSDLAALKTRAVRHDDVYTVKGQKVYVTSAHYATHLWLAVRTDESAPRHAGISVVVVPVDAPGVTIRPMETQADGWTNEVFLDDVVVSVGDRIGGENAGWKVITAALDLERNFPYSGLARDFEDLIRWASERPRGDNAMLIDDPFVRAELTKLAVDLEVARLLAMRAAWLAEEGMEATSESSMTKIWTSELRDRVAGFGLELMGSSGQLRAGDPRAEIDGCLEQVYRWSPMMKIGGGANEIQRNIIARGLGLGREA
jgi:alkylation response protein AidB-like acyl-CoA dehydrogenase